MEHGEEEKDDNNDTMMTMKMFKMRILFNPNMTSMLEMRFKDHLEGLANLKNKPPIISDKEEDIDVKE